MSTLMSFLRKHAIVVYFILAIAVSWGGILIVIGGFGAFPATQTESTALIGPVAGMLMLGPVVAGLLMTVVVYGWAGLRAMWSRLLTWRVSIRWYAIALLTAPVVILVTLLPLSLFSPHFLPGVFVSPDRTGLLAGALAAGLAGGLMEEIGWTGFAVPEMRKRYSILTTGLVVGFLWGVWHYFVAVWASGDATGALSWGLLIPQLVFYVAFLPVYRVLMVWVYDNTESLLLAMLMHASLTANVLFLFMPLDISNSGLVIWYLLMSALLWIAAYFALRSGRASPNVAKR